VEGNQNYPLLLLHLVDKSEVDMHLRVGAAITLKNFVKRNWKLVCVMKVISVFYHCCIFKDWGYSVLGELGLHCRLSRAFSHEYEKVDMVYRWTNICDSTENKDMKTRTILCIYCLPFARHLKPAFILYILANMCFH
jgi:hypothetical protein